MFINKETIKTLSKESKVSDSTSSKIINKIDINGSIVDANIRKDKVFKNVFRATKKYYLKLFKTNSKFFKISSKAERKKTIYSELEEFVKKFFISKDTMVLLIYTINIIN